MKVKDLEKLRLRINLWDKKATFGIFWQKCFFYLGSRKWVVWPNLEVPLWFTFRHHKPGSSFTRFSVWPKRLVVLPSVVRESPSFFLPVQLLNPFFCSRMVSLTSFVFPRSFPSVFLQVFSLNHSQSSPIVAQFVRGYFSWWNSWLSLLGHHRDVFWSKRMRRLCC